MKREKAARQGTFKTVRSTILAGVLIQTLLGFGVTPAAATGTGEPAPSPQQPAPLSHDTLGTPPPEQPRIVEKIYEIGSAWYDHYQAAEAARNDVSLTAPHRLEITPAVLKVTENASNRLPGVEAKAGVAWVPYKGQTTNVFWEFQVGNGKGGAGSISRTGVPTKAEWEKWYRDRGPYRPSPEGFDNDHLKIVFDAVAPGEAFNEGINTVKVRLWGWTRIWLNWWDLSNWWGSPVETKAFDETLSQEKDVEVNLPYEVRKNPNLDAVEKPHPASLTVELWDKNLARTAFSGNIQNYYEPKVRVLCDDGTIPPDDGTSNNEKMVCSDSRTHTGPHPPARIHVLPDFDPISVIVKHIVWDLPENRGKIYERPLTLRPTALWCVQPGVPDSVPNTPDEPTLGPIPRQVETPWRTVVAPAPRVLDPDFGPQSVEQQVRIEVLSHGMGASPETLWVDGGMPQSVFPNILHSGDTVEFRWTLRDIFGRNFGTSQTVAVPPPTDLAPDSIFLARPDLQLIQREHEPDPVHQVEVVCVDLAGLAFGEMRSVENVLVMDLATGQQHLSDGEGVAREQVPDGGRFQFAIQDPQQRYIPLLLPPSPPVLKSLTVQNDQAPPGFRDDRLFLWLSPSFAHGPLALGSGRIRRTVDGYLCDVGGVSNLDPQSIADAHFEYLDGSILAQARVSNWGISDRRGLGYLPARFDLAGADLGPTQVQRLVSDGAVRLSVETRERTATVLVIPITYTDMTTNVAEPLPSNVSLLPPAPNPTKGASTIRYQLSQESSMRLSVYDVLGRRVKSLAEAHQSAGEHAVIWDGRDGQGNALPAALYFIQLETGDRIEKQKLMLLR